MNKCDLKIYNNQLLPFCLVPIYLGVKLDKLLTFRHRRLALREKNFLLVSSCLGELRLRASAGATTPRTAVLFLIYLTADYWIPCFVALLMKCDVLNDALREVTECLCSSPKTHLPVFINIHLFHL